MHSHQIPQDILKVSPWIICVHIMTYLEVYQVTVNIEKHINELPIFTKLLREK